jgi:DNA-binding transcriptional MerR regulator
VAAVEATSETVLELLMVGDAAMICGVSNDTIRQAVEDGRLQIAATTPSGMRLFTVDAVQRFRRDRELAREERARR